MEPAADALARARAIAGRAPQFSADLAGFAQRLAELTADGTSRTDDQLDDLYLTWCCTAGCERALEALWTCHVPAVRRAAASVLKNEAAADDVAQVVLHRLLVGSADKPPALGEFRGTSRLSRWLRSTAVRQALTARRLGDRKIDEEVVLERIAADSAGPELALLKQSSGRAVEDALRRSLAELPASERLLLQQHLVDGLTIDDLASVYRVHRATAARRIAAARASLLERMRAQLQNELRLGESEIDSMLDFAHSRIQISLRWFGEQSAPQPAAIESD